MRIIASSAGLVCPYSLTKRYTFHQRIYIFHFRKFSIFFRYLQRLGPDHLGSLQPSCRPNDPDLPHASKSISYTNAVNNLRSTITSLGYEGHKFSEHSSRRGAATRSAEVGVEEQIIQVAGDWKDPRTVRKYIDRDPKEHQRLTARIMN